MMSRPKTTPFAKDGVIRYIVSGQLPFPIDMLRYDRAWPATEASSYQIESSLQGANEKALDIAVNARGPLTEGRWNSRGWQIKCVGPERNL